MSTSRPHSSGRRGPPSGRSSHARSADVEPLHPTATPPDIESFRQWALEAHVQDVIEGMGITNPTPIQRLAIGPVLEGKDVIAKAETGTGKTLAFGAPMMSKIDPARATVLGLVLTPTRELAEQVATVLKQLGEPRGIKLALVVGGEPMDAQVRALQSGAQVVVGTPGRVLDLYRQKFLSFPWTEFAVLDEADEMLEIGFLDDVEKILSFMPDERQTLLFSATFPAALLKLARKHTKSPAEVATASGVKTVDNIAQSWMAIHEDDKPLALIRMIEQSEEKDVLLVFCNRREDVDRLMRRLERIRFSIKALHGGYDQAARFRVMSAFRTGEVKALVATDVASRGLDVSHVTHVINFDVPRDITGYTHRIGRTGRAGRKGKSITLVSPEDQRRWKPIQKQATWDIAEEELPRPTNFSRPAPREQAPREQAPREQAPREQAPREQAPREHAPREHAPREHAPRERAPRSREHSESNPHSRSHAPAHRPAGHRPAAHPPATPRPAERAPAAHRPAAHRPASHPAAAHRPAAHPPAARRPHASDAPRTREGSPRHAPAHGETRRAPAAHDKPREAGHARRPHAEPRTDSAPARPRYTGRKRPDVD